MTLEELLARVASMRDGRLTLSLEGDRRRGDVVTIALRVEGFELHARADGRGPVVFSERALDPRVSCVGRSLVLEDTFRLVLRDVGDEVQRRTERPISDLADALGLGRGHLVPCGHPLGSDTCRKCSP